MLVELCQHYVVLGLLVTSFGSGLVSAKVVNRLVAPVDMQNDIFVGPNDRNEVNDCKSSVVRWIDDLHRKIVHKVHVKLCKMTYKYMKNVLGIKEFNLDTPCND
ncbi:uncharacterized protein LOC126846550 [Adelges cooleyi]|uniref:uncharacterized protein LOC126846550 n=1 Tax=Adelges cooleyi TaxID=133065 RepID=UPI00218052C4|nr:uncharacterized protein LOC126846550 [Adelges cooleyi]